MFTLREDQNDALHELRMAVAQGERRIVMQAPCGFGKTILSSAIVDSALSKGKKILFVVPAKSLVDQTIEMFAANDIHDVGAIQADHPMTDWNRPVQVATVQSLMRRQIPRADVVLIDEVHRFFRFYEKWLRDISWQNIPFIGLSATPWTKGLGAYFNRLIIASTTAEMIEQGLLSPFRVFAASHPDLTGVRTVAGDYHEGDLSNNLDRPKLVADVVQTWLKLGENRPTFCFCINRNHAKNLQNQFEAAGVGCAYQDMDTKTDERRAIKRRFESGEIKVVTSVETMIMGIDWDVRCIIFCRPTKSEMLYCQAIGRGLRTADGKKDCLILDHSDNTLRLGFVTDIHYTELHDGKTAPKQENAGDIRLPKECPSCGYVKPPKMARCPNCNFVAERKPNEIEVADGELKEVKPPKKNKDAISRFPDKQTTYSQLLHYSREHGYKDGWVSHKYREIYGVWPRGLAASTQRPSDDLLGWLRHKQIKWAKRRTSAPSPVQSVVEDDDNWSMAS